MWHNNTNLEHLNLYCCSTPSFLQRNLIFYNNTYSPGLHCDHLTFSNTLFHPIRNTPCSYSWMHQPLVHCPFFLMEACPVQSLH